MDLLSTIDNYIYYLKSIILYNKRNKQHDFPLKLSNLWPIVNERFNEAGNIDNHYFFQDIWAAQKILQVNPKDHIDIGSRLDGFISHLLVFRKVKYVDIRPLKKTINNLEFICDNATTLHKFSDDSIESLSCLHAAEHFGLGRYNDPIDPDAYKQLINNIQRSLKKGGRVYFSVPIGVEKLQFNAQRVFNPNTIISLFNSLTLQSFSAVNDKGEFIENTNPDNFLNEAYGCGMFEFVK